MAEKRNQTIDTALRHLASIPPTPASRRLHPSLAPVPSPKKPGGSIGPMFERFKRQKAGRDGERLFLQRHSASVRNACNGKTEIPSETMDGVLDLITHPRKYGGLEKWVEQVSTLMDSIGDAGPNSSESAKEIFKALEPSILSMSDGIVSKAILLFSSNGPKEHWEKLRAVCAFLRRFDGKLSSESNELLSDRLGSVSDFLAIYDRATEGGKRPPLSAPLPR